MIAPEDTAPAPATRRFTVRKSLRWAERVLALVGLCFIIYRLGFEVMVMTSDSMSPTLRGNAYDNGDRILVEKVTGWFRRPHRWEIYFFYDAEGTPVAKRIVGLPGEKISIRQQRIYINGSEIQPPERLRFLKFYPFGNLLGGKEADCGSGYYVLGDDSRDSYDSRYLGPVAGSRFRGRVWCILGPRGRRGFVE